MTLSFSPEFVDGVGWVPLVYGASIMGVGLIYVTIFRWMGRASTRQGQTQGPSSWDLFVLRHAHPLNLKIHLLAFIMFWGGPVLAVAFSDWRWLIPFFLSGPMGAFGHWISKDSSVSLKEATHSLDAIHFSSRMCLLVLFGRYENIRRKTYRKYSHLLLSQEP